jgi:chromosome segregation ATPase
MADTAVINQLLQEAITRSVALAEQAQQTSGVVEELFHRAGSLAEALGEGGHAAHQRFQDLRAGLEAADDELEDRAMRARGGLEALPAKAAFVQGRVGDLLATIKHELSELKAKEDDLSVTLERQSEEAQADLEQLAGQTRKLQEVTEARLQEATEELESLHAAIAQAREDIHKAKGELLEAMDTLENAAREQVQRFVEGLGTTLTAHTTALFDLEHRLKDAHNEAVVALRKKFAEEVVSRLSAAAAPLKESLDRLSALCAEEESALIEECARLVERFDVAIASAGRSQDLLRVADRLV